VVGIRRARIEAAQLVLRSDDVRHALEDFRHRDERSEDRTLVDEIRQTPRARLVPKFGSGLGAFLRPQRLHAIA
jgi:hypothetical protein